MYVPSTPATGEKWQAGFHYNVLLPPVEPFGDTNRVEILELSMYTSLASTPEFRAALQSWLQQNKSKMYYRREPSVAMGMPHARLQARTFWTLEQLGRRDLHEAFELWVKDPDRERYYHNIWDPNPRLLLRMDLEFLKTYRLGYTDFLRIYRSRETELKVRDSEIRTAASSVNGTPTLVVNRRYSASAQRLTYPADTTASDMLRLLELIEYLAEAEFRRLTAISGNDDATGCSGC